MAKHIEGRRVCAKEGRKEREGNAERERRGECSEKERGRGERRANEMRGAKMKVEGRQQEIKNE